MLTAGRWPARWRAQRSCACLREAEWPLPSSGRRKLIRWACLGSSYYTGRVAVITGAGSGIGRALAVRLAREGALLALLDRDGPAAEATARQCRDAGARAWAATVDVTDREALDTCAAAAAAEFGRIDLLCCAAGVIHTGTVLASSWDDTARVVEGQPARHDGHRGGLPPLPAAPRAAGTWSCAPAGSGCSALPGTPRTARRNSPCGDSARRFGWRWRSAAIGSR